MLPQSRYEAICPHACSRALGIPTKGLDKSSPELRLVQRGLDKLARRCCASFFLSSGFKAKLGQNHRIETPQWPDSIHPSMRCDMAVRAQHLLLTHCVLILPCPPSPSGSGGSFWGLHALLLLCLCLSVCLGPWPGILEWDACLEG